MVIPVLFGIKKTKKIKISYIPLLHPYTVTSIHIKISTTDNPTLTISKLKYTECIQSETNTYKYTVCDQKLNIMLSKLLHKNDLF